MNAKLRILIHPEYDAALFNAVTGILADAVKAEPDTFEHVEGEPNRVDHWAYYTDTLSATILVQKYNSTFHRLTIRMDEHPVYDTIRSLVAEHYGM
jgi:hypothetical protein